MSTFTGFDCPEAIAGLSSVETSAGVVSLAWTAPEKGEHNGVIKTDELKYTVVRVDEQGTAVSTVAETSPPHHIPTSPRSTGSRNS